MPYEQDMRAAKRQQMLAQMIQQQGQQALQGSQGRYFVAPSRTASILGALQQVGGSFMGVNADKKMGTLEDQRKQQLAEQIAKMAGVKTGASAPASVEPAPPVMGFQPPPEREPSKIDALQGGGRNQQMAAALQAISLMPVAQQEQILGSQAMTQLFPKAPEDYTLSAGQKRFSGGREVASVPSDAVEKILGPNGAAIFASRDKAIGQTPYEAEPEAVRSARAFLDNPDLAAVDQARKKAGASAVNVNTERNLYGTMADKQGAANVDQFTQAQKAPQLLQRTQRVREALGPESKAITGTGAEQLLTLSKVAAQMGFNTGDAAADTEMLSRELASSTLDAIKASGLGAGSGFSNADRDFLEKAVGGKITMEAATLRKLADLNERAALASIKQWNATAGRLDPQQLQALGMSPIEMPAGTPAPSATPKLQQNPDGSYVYNP